MRSTGTSVQLSIRNHRADVLLSSENGLNVLSSSVIQDMHDALDQIQDNGKIRAVCLRSASPKAFSSGADIVEMVTNTPLEADEFSKLGQSLVRRLELELPPVVASMRGYVLGGGLEIVAGCDIRIASESCIFSQPEIDIGVIPGWGGTQRLARIVGMGKASEMIFLGTRIDAHLALEAGLVNMVAPDDALDEVTEKVMDKLCGMSRASLVAAKRAIRSSVEAPYETGLEVERKEWSSLFGTPDQKEGMRAFLEKRKAKFVD